MFRYTYLYSRCLTGLCLLFAFWAPVCSSANGAGRLDAITILDEGAVEILPVSVFGDGDDDNGDEDSRVALASAQWREQKLGLWSLSAGTVHCEGKMRGTAIILDIREMSWQPRGHVLMTAAHVLFDLESGRRFAECSFHYLGMSQLPGYQSRIDLASTRMGRFDPLQARAQLEFGREDWAYLYVPRVIPAITTGAQIRPAIYGDFAARDSTAEQFWLLAWSERHEAVSVSLDCTPVESRSDDLGGGSWAGQILDDCDSGQGASGGGLIADISGNPVLIGIRTGAHWNSETFPSQSFPDGPPPGAVWDTRQNTNFARAIDHQLLDELRLFVRLLDTSRAF